MVILIAASEMQVSYSLGLSFFVHFKWCNFFFVSSFVIDQLKEGLPYIDVCNTIKNDA